MDLIDLFWKDNYESEIYGQIPAFRIILMAMQMFSRIFNPLEKLQKYIQMILID